MIKSENLVYEYRRNTADDTEIRTRVLDGLNIDIKDGQFISIVGHNGSGKSTLQDILMRFLLLQEVHYG